MTCTVACFCGNVYTAPPNRCDECGCTFGDSAPSPTASATDGHALPPKPPPPSDATAGGRAHRRDYAELMARQVRNWLDLNTLNGLV